jgi:hypothetical protein
MSLLAGVAGVTVAATGFAIAPPAAYAASAPTPPPVSFTTQGSTMWKVPPGVTQLRVVAIGAKGFDTPVNSFFRATGGRGSRVTTTLDVTPGSTLHINVGVGGGTSRWGGDGGGAADVRAAPFGLADRLIVAAGGGGAGADSAQCGTPGTGGTGGGGAGAPGPAQHDQCSPGGSGGGGATATAGGTGGDAFYVIIHHSGDGTLGSGGIALGDDATDGVGGGGGGGWYGGGAGGGLYQGFAGSGGGGGGGSDHVAPGARNTAIADGVNTGGAQVTITPVVAATVSFTSAYGNRQADLLHRLAARTHRSDADAQHDAALSFARLVEWYASRGPNHARTANDNAQQINNEARTADTADRRDVTRVTSTYSTLDAAVITKVAHRFHMSESTFQRIAVVLISRTSHN